MSEMVFGFWQPDYLIHIATLPTANYKLQTFPTANCQLKTANCLIPFASKAVI